jgi:hypothetical protein
MGLSFVYAVGLRQVVFLGCENLGTRDHIFAFKSKLKLYYDLRSAGQSVLVSSAHLELTTRFVLLSGTCGFDDVRRSL